MTVFSSTFALIDDFSYLPNMLSMSSKPFTALPLVNADNSQNMALLSSAINFDPTASIGGGNTVVIAESALLPETGPSGSLADIEEYEPSDQINIYVVREGDSLSQIAQMFNVSANTIVWANEIKHDAYIRTGQTLIILPVTGVRHTVKSGDTVASIAKKYNGHIDDILNYNRIDESVKLTVGDIVVVPDGEIATPKNVASSPSYTATVRGNTGPDLSGYYMRPIAGGRRSQGLHGYNGVDLAVSLGSPIFASATGDVIISKNSGWNGGYGKYVVIKHSNGTQTLYAHNSSNIVFVGQHVVKGQVIGYVGSSGKSTGSHVHFEVRGAKNPF